MKSLFQDLRYGLRQLRNNRGFAVTAILTLSLSIGASAAIFAFVDAALIKPLPYKQPSQLVNLYESIPLGPRFHLSYPDYLDWKKMNTVFSSLDIYENQGFMLSTPEGAQLADGARVSAGFFRTLGVAPVLGRDFRPDEDQPSSAPAVLLSYGEWQKRYGGRKDILGQTLILDGTPNIIIGVLPPEFHFAPAEPTDFWSTMLSADRLCRGCHGLYGVARLKDGVSFSTAFANITTIAQQLEKQYPNTNRDQAAYMLPLTDVIVGDIRPILLVLFGNNNGLAVRTAFDPGLVTKSARAAVVTAEPTQLLSPMETIDHKVDDDFKGERFGVVLFGAFAGLALLLAALGIYGVMAFAVAQRRHEIGLRMALGAQQDGVVKMILTDGLKLALSGVAVGLMGVYGLGRLMRTTLYGIQTVDLKSFATVSLVLVAAAVIASYVPARRSAKVDPMVALRYE